MRTDFSYLSGGEKIMASKYGNEPPEVIFLHGAGKSNRFRTAYLSEFLHNEMRVSSLAIDFSGHGDSSGTIGNSSLSKRLDEIYTITNFVELPKAVKICATSMGGHIAIKLLEKTDLNVDKLFLFCPAIYSYKAFNAKFDSGFSEIIRKKDSWKESGLENLLSHFQGQIQVLIGEMDNVIPEGVIDLIAEHSKNFHLEKIQNCDHFIHKHLSSDPSKVETVCNMIVSSTTDEPLST